ncbi:MAG: dockerin type I repeat-containing protein, partial [Candidatus Glassbacteria bacterium]|nr:dockerin type I repeat-containing protein [Candidatus Glassbacteria bacterium]
DLITPGEQARVVVSLTAMGAAASSVSATVSSASPDVSVVSGTASFGNIAAGGEASNAANPFVLSFSRQMPEGIARAFSLQITGGGITRTVSFTLAVGTESEQPVKGVAGHTVGKARLSLTNYGVIGTDGEDGGGFLYPYTGASTPDQLYQGALLIASGPLNVSDATYNEQTSGYTLEFDQDFTSVKGGNIRVLEPGVYSDQEITGAYADSRAARPLGVEVYQTSYAWSSASDDDYVIVEYTLAGPADREVNGVYLAQHLDWDVGQWSGSGEDDMVGYESGLRLAYMYDNGSNACVGHALLTQQVSGFRAINYQRDISNGFTGAEKFSCMTSGARDTVVAVADDWSELLCAGPVWLKPGREVVVAFAVAGGNTLAELRDNVAAARARYQVLAGLKEVDLEPPAISSEPLPDMDLALDSYPVQAVVADENGIDKVLIFWRLRDVGVFSGVEIMSPQEDSPGTYAASIPAQALGRVVDYYLRAADAQGNLGYAPGGAPADFFSFRVIDTLPPVLSAVVLPADTDDTAGPYALSVAAADPGGIGRVEVVYSTGTVGWADTLGLETEGDSIFSGGLPGAKAGTAFRLFFRAVDSSGNASYLPRDAPGTYFSFGVVDLAGPVITNAAAFLDTLDGDYYSLRAAVLDEWLARVYAVLGVGPELADTVEMAPVPGSPGIFAGMVGEYPRGARVDFYIVAADSFGNLTTDPAAAPDSLYSFTYSPPLSGDLDLSGAVDIFDLLTLLQALGGQITLDPQRLRAADIDRSGRVDIFDLLSLLQLLSAQ